MSMVPVQIERADCRGIVIGDGSISWVEHWTSIRQVLLVAAKHVQAEGGFAAAILLFDGNTIVIHEKHQGWTEFMASAERYLPQFPTVANCIPQLKNVSGVILYEAFEPIMFN